MDLFGMMSMVKIRPKWHRTTTSSKPVSVVGVRHTQRRLRDGDGLLVGAVRPHHHGLGVTLVTQQQKQERHSTSDDFSRQGTHLGNRPQS